MKTRKRMKKSTTRKNAERESVNVAKNVEWKRS